MADAQKELPKKRIDDIEILRAFAVILVIIEHMKLNLFHWSTPALKLFYDNFGGWTGVDLFFAISGYVIARDLVPKLRGAESRDSYFSITLAFWARRFWRLIPSAWTWLTLVLLASVFCNNTGAWGTVPNNVETVLSAFLQIANFHVAHVYGKEFPGAAFVYWSLSLEEQFYLLLPLLVFVCNRKLAYVLGAFVLLQIFLARETALLALTRTDALFLGVLIALWAQHPSYRLFKPQFLVHPLGALAFLTLLLLALACVGSEGLRIIEFRYGLIALISALLVLAASYDQNYYSRPGVVKTLLLWTGTRSYALYLTHVPSYFLTREIWFWLEPAGTKFNTQYTYSFLATALILLLVMSELNYRFIEVPFRRRGVEVARRMAVKRGRGEV